MLDCLGGFAEMVRREKPLGCWGNRVMGSQRDNECRPAGERRLFTRFALNPRWPVKKLDARPVVGEHNGKSGSF